MNNPCNFYLYAPNLKTRMFLYFHVNKTHRLFPGEYIFFLLFSSLSCVVTFRNNLTIFVTRQVNKILCYWLNVHVRTCCNSDGQVIYTFRLMEYTLFFKEIGLRCLAQPHLLKGWNASWWVNLENINWSTDSKEEWTQLSHWEHMHCGSIYKFRFWFDHFILKVQWDLESSCEPLSPCLTSG